MKLMSEMYDVPDSDYEIVKAAENKLAIKIDKKYDTKVIEIIIFGVY